MNVQHKTVGKKRRVRKTHQIDKLKASENFTQTSKEREEKKMKDR